MDLVLRVVEAPGAGPAIGAAEDRVRPMRVVDAAQFRSGAVERFRPGNSDELIAPAPAVRPRAALQPAAPDHRPGKSGAMRHRGRDIPEQARWVGIAGV